jgi:hypothetical protein
MKQILTSECVGRHIDRKTAEGVLCEHLGNVGYCLFFKIACDHIRIEE